VAGGYMQLATALAPSTDAMAVATAAIILRIIFTFFIFAFFEV
jgi:hypothetical protein